MRWTLPILVAFAPLPAAQAAPDSGWSYVIYSDGATSSFGSGEVNDFTTASRHRAGKAPMLYVRRGGTAYVIRDAAIMARANTIMAPQRELGRRQGALGDRQAALGREQSKLGTHQGRVGAQMVNATPATMRQLGRLQSQLGTAQSALGSQQALLGAKQSELGREQSREAAIAEPKLRALVEDAVRRGLAQRVD